MNEELEAGISKSSLFNGSRFLQVDVCGAERIIICWMAEDRSRFHMKSCGCDCFICLMTRMIHNVNDSRHGCLMTLNKNLCWILKIRLTLLSLLFRFRDRNCGKRSVRVCAVKKAANAKPPFRSTAPKPTSASRGSAK